MLSLNNLTAHMPMPMSCAFKRYGTSYIELEKQIRLKTTCTNIIACIMFVTFNAGFVTIYGKKYKKKS